MRRSFTLIRLTLEYVEKNQNGPLPLPEIDGYTEAQIAEHALLCCEAGFLNCEIQEPGLGQKSQKVLSILRMTWAGHEKLNQLRRTTPP